MILSPLSQTPGWWGGMLLHKSPLAQWFQAGLRTLPEQRNASIHNPLHKSHSIKLYVFPCTPPDFPDCLWFGYSTKNSYLNHSFNVILKQAVKPFPFRLVCGKQAGATFEFCTFIRKPIKGLDNKLLLITLTFLEALIVTVIVRTCNKKIPGKWTFPSDVLNKFINIQWREETGTYPQKSLIQWFWKLGRYK